ncbi:putative H+-transporting two-sector ATPase chain b precursor, mitochondrial [Jaminaea rosea]|uniref:ATP synthase subunit 4 n=1 Tax=Jaminaea rosea TaxID=1569628 RepID=A0A316UPR0_9BASI|nr:putative H+-transporting two-sector ATPase chain b precursor, mitochondrial [Jaminaea rosea]PWN26768.1 putative H+-transporting two-sector ATPase chain b precursor, mitochondrial [Jaminaea rosea]
MSFRIAAQRSAALRSAVARPATAAPASAAFSTTSRTLQAAQKPEPSERAASIIDSLPGNSLISKAGIVTLGTGLSAVAISKELYVANEETVIAGGFLIFAVLVGRMIAKPYGEWADGASGKIRDVLLGARKDHTEAVQARIDSVEQQKDVSAHTSALFALAKETAQNESVAFELKQRTELASEVKAVLDSWVRYEGQQREEEQRQLARSVIEKVTASLRDEKTQKQILDDAVAEIEGLVKSKAI